VSIETSEEIEMNKIEQRVRRYKEDWQLLSDTLPTGRITIDILYNFLNTKRKLEEKFLADIITLSKTL
jgi:hypothetical protein